MSTIENFDLQSHISASVISTFDTMLSLEIKPVDVDPPPGSGIARMVGTLNFAGNVSGIFNVQTTIDFGRLMASGLLGKEPEAVDPKSDIRDLLAEVTNIVGGNLKSSLNDAGHACILSTPSITYGTDFSIKSLSMDRFARFVFQHAEHVLIIEVGLKAVAGADGIDLSSPEAMSRLPDVDIEKLNALDYKTRLSAAAVSVFDTMLSLTLEPVSAVTSSSLNGIREVSSVCFAGDATGIVSVHVPEDLALIMAAGMLGMEPEEIEGHAEIQDLLGELANIVGGNLKSALTDPGLRCALSTPSFTTGSDLRAMVRANRWLDARPDCGPTIVFGLDLGQHVSMAGGADGAASAYQRQILVISRARGADDPDLTAAAAESELRTFLAQAENRAALFDGRRFLREPLILSP